MGDIIGRRFSNALAFFAMSIACIPAAMVARDVESEITLTMIVVFIKFCTSITFFAVNLQSMEIYPTCLRQSGIAVGSIVANTLAVFGPYIVHLGTQYDVRYPYFVLGEKKNYSHKIYLLKFIDAHEKIKIPRWIMFYGFLCCNVFA